MCSAPWDKIRPRLRFASAARTGRTKVRFTVSVSNCNEGHFGSDTRISFEDFVPIYASVSKRPAQHSKEQFVEGLSHFDREGNGTIAVAEVSWKWSYLLTSNINTKNSHSALNSSSTCWPRWASGWRTRRWTSWWQATTRAALWTSTHLWTPSSTDRYRINAEKNVPQS